MKERAKRTRRLQDLREKELGERVGELRRAQDAEALALSELDRARTEIRRAEAERARLAAKPAGGEDWRAADDWLLSRHAAERAQKARAEAAVVERRKAESLVVEAQLKVKRLEKLVVRIQTEEASRRARADQRAEDAVAARVARAEQSDRGNR